MPEHPYKEASGPLSPGERARVRVSAPAIRTVVSIGGRGPELPRKLRRDQTDAERRLWRELRGRLQQGIKFRRQQAIGPYIVDFYCHEHRLVVEVDGSQHQEAVGVTADEERTAWLEARGLKVLRLDNRYVLTETENAVATILFAIEEGWPSP